MDLRHPLADEDLLGAPLLSLTALDARAGARGLGQHIAVEHARAADFIVHFSKVV